MVYAYFMRIFEQIWMMSATNLNTARPEWMSAQVTVNSRSDFKVVMEGKASNGGYAIDQLVFSPGKCSSMLLSIF